MKTLILTTLLVLSLAAAKAQPTHVFTNITQCPLKITEHCVTVLANGSCAWSPSTIPSDPIPPGGGVYHYGGCSSGYLVYEICWDPPTCPANSGVCVFICQASICGISNTAVLNNDCPNCTPHTNGPGANVSIDMNGDILVDRIYP